MVVSILKLENDSANTEPIAVAVIPINHVLRKIFFTILFFIHFQHREAKALMVFGFHLLF